MTPIVRPHRPGILFLFCGALLCLYGCGSKPSFPRGLDDPAPYLALMDGTFRANVEKAGKVELLAIARKTGEQWKAWTPDGTVIEGFELSPPSRPAGITRTEGRTEGTFGLLFAVRRTNAPEKHSLFDGFTAGGGPIPGAARISSNPLDSVYTQDGEPVCSGISLGIQRSEMVAADTQSGWAFGWFTFAPDPVPLTMFFYPFLDTGEKQVVAEVGVNRTIYRQPGGRTLTGTQYDARILDDSVERFRADIPHGTQGGAVTALPRRGPIFVTTLAWPRLERAVAIDLSGNETPGSNITGGHHWFPVEDAGGVNLFSQTWRFEPVSAREIDRFEFRKPVRASCLFRDIPMQPGAGWRTSIRDGGQRSAGAE